MNNLFKVTSLDKEGWEENFIYETNVIAEVSQFMLTFEFFNNIDFNFLRSEIVLNLTSLAYKIDVFFR